MDRYKRQFQVLCKYLKKIEKYRPPMQEYIRLMSDLSRELMEVERCIFWLYDQEKGKIFSQVSEDIGYCEVDAFDGIIGQVIRSGETRLVNDYTKDPYYDPKIERVTGFSIRSSVCVPLKHSDNTVYGALQVINKLSGGHFDDEDMEMMIFVALYCEEALTSFFFEEELIQTQNDIVFLLAELGESRSKDTGMHVRRVSAMAAYLGELAELPPNEVHLLRLASPLHDLGKVGIQDAILNKPDKLTEEEYLSMKRHTKIGHRILGSMQRKLLRVADTIAHQHHERYDGKGYPQGLSGEEISLYARITSICDVFDALANRRPYKDAWDKKAIYEEFLSERGRQFDPRLTDLFLSHFDDFFNILQQYPEPD